MDSRLFYAPPPVDLAGKNQCWNLHEVLYHGKLAELDMFSDPDWSVVLPTDTCSLWLKTTAQSHLSRLSSLE